MLIESSTVTPCSPLGLAVLLGAGQAGQDQRLLAVHDVAAVELGADLHGQLAVLAAPRTCRRCRARRARSCRPAPTNTFTSPRCIAWSVATTSQAVLARRVDAADLGEPVQELLRPGGGRCRRCGCPARCCGRGLGQGPAPSRPMLPRSSSRLTISRTVSTPCSCWVTPRHQAMMTRLRLPVGVARARGSPARRRRTAGQLVPGRRLARAPGTPRSRACSASRNSPVERRPGPSPPPRRPPWPRRAAAPCRRRSAAGRSSCRSWWCGRWPCRRTRAARSSGATPPRSAG